LDDDDHDDDDDDNEEDGDHMRFIPPLSYPHFLSFIF
jgi:hypothetical protein